MAVKWEGVLWISSLLFRFLWVLYPQTGYIHPDEFFQSPEIVAGDIFGVQSLRTWEFNETLPIRSILLPYIFTGLPFRMLQKLHNLTILPWSLNTRELVVAPRLAICCLSTLLDLCALKITCLLGRDPSAVLGVIGTSYVMLVFHTRPFSNTLESALFALMLWILAEHLLPKERTTARIKNIGIGMVFVAGVWNRPTFLAYALIPLLSWCYNFFKDSNISWTSTVTFAKQTCFVGIGAVCTVVLFITADSLYFGSVTITPVNFIKYNLDTSHLKEHGLHPRFTHFLVNMPLLFGVLALIYYCQVVIITFTRNFNDSKHILDPDTKDSKQNERSEQSSNAKLLLYKVLTLSIIVPVGLLSLIPHQEPRFITPILIPLAILFAPIIIGPKQSSLVTASWLIWNIIGCVVFGVLHQGGMYPCMHYLQRHLSPVPSGSKISTYHVVFSNTYMPPRHLLAWPVCKGNDCPVMNNLVVHDLGGQTTVELKSRLDHLIEMMMDNNEVYQVFLVCPSTLYFNHPEFHKVNEFFPHLSMEDPPNIGSFLDFDSDCENNGLSQSKKCLLGNVTQRNWLFLSSWLTSNFSLNLYKYKQSTQSTKEEYTDHNKFINQ